MVVPRLDFADDVSFVAGREDILDKDMEIAPKDALVSTISSSHARRSFCGTYLSLWTRRGVRCRRPRGKGSKILYLAPRIIERRGAR